MDGEVRKMSGSATECDLEMLLTELKHKAHGGISITF